MIHSRQAVAALSLCSIVSAALAGPLTPPAGAPASTGLTLQQVANQVVSGVEPRIPISQTTTPGGNSSAFEINQPGSYYLTADVVGTVNEFGIRVNAPNVTIDLNGFAVRGVPGSSSGVFFNDADGCILRNGFVSGWGNQGVRGTNSDSLRVIDVVSNNNASNGFQLGDSTYLYGCAAERNGADGISTGFSCVVIECQAQSNGQSGISIGQGSLARGCTTQNNTGDGISGNSGVSVVECVSRRDTVNGIDVGTASTVRGCNVTKSGNYGIDLSTGATAADNTVFDPGVAGINAGTSTTMINNRCSAFSAFSSTAVGIRLSVRDARVEGNQISQLVTGILVTGSDRGNIIIGNRLAGNTTAFDVQPGNFVGTIVQPTATTSAILGTGVTGPIGIGTTDLYANIVY